MRREFAADAFAVEMTQNPLALIEALEKIHMEIYECPDEQVAFKPLFFADNFKGRSETVNRLQNFLFPSHPKPEDRVKRLYHMIKR
ncbi:MAG: M48 family metalloprotease [Desulfobacterium sp.]|nr:M48 family metalloprotease [Desulfobacterium sp.]